ncbi:hypothetical protein NAPIS_ORF00290 [Vairimorpha apis BRL 01]|uniref:Uncharacterized protein n=1 Tax=Vairimorpha apis BRL 01 TaxID=1037528 RepID=T0LCV0_9MICR|nr:hypothetical protein NAPIS_ORF00290 [Vairimorpha apis BRL 01]
MSKVNHMLYFYIVVICLKFHTFYIMCSLNNFDKIELIKLTPLQQIEINILLQDLTPGFILETYLIDPTNTNTCYLFIENTTTKEIKHYDMFLDNKQSFNSIKDKILYGDLSINNIFNFVFKDTLNIHHEVAILNNSSTIYDITIYNRFIKLIINKYSALIHILDSSFKNEITLNDIFLKISSIDTNLVCQVLTKYLNLEHKFSKTKKYNNCCFSKYYKKIEHFESYIFKNYLDQKIIFI